MSFASESAAARACTLCAPHLRDGVRPVFRGKPSARLMLIGQAPGRRVHESGVPWDDPSGDRLREWLGLDRTAFYNERKFAILPMGLCYPGTDKRGADFPPRPECAPLWHPRLLPLFPKIETTLLIGQYAQARYLGPARAATLTDTVRAWRKHVPEFLALPHPSWRNTGWLKANPWFAREVLPWLRERVAALTA
ncbi:MAG: uracil-DNA glycosylase family protein [Tagaea sp.]